MNSIGLCNRVQSFVAVVVDFARAADDADDADDNDDDEGHWWQIAAGNLSLSDENCLTRIPRRNLHEEMEKPASQIHVVARRRVPTFSRFTARNRTRSAIVKHDSSE